MTNETPLVSILIPTYNRANLIAETLDSVLSQKYQNWECIVVDDGSTDTTAAVLAQYLKKDARFQYHHRPKNRLPGGNAARNYGLEVSKGKYVQWFDSDDLMHPELLAQCVAKINNTQFDYVITNFQKITSEGKISSNANFPSVEKIHTEFLCQRTALNTLTFFYAKKSLSNFAYDETLKNAQDLDFISRFLKLGKKGTINNEYLFSVRIHNKTITSKFKNKEKKAVLTELKVRKENLSYAMQKFNKEDIASMRQKLLAKSLKLGQIDKQAFFKMILNFRKENFLSLKATIKILFWTSVHSISGRGKEHYKRAAYNG